MRRLEKGEPRSDHRKQGSLTLGQRGDVSFFPAGGAIQLIIRGELALAGKKRLPEVFPN